MSRPRITPPRLSLEETLVLLIEECAEVQHAAAKALRFGFENDWTGYGRNSTVLAREIGELEAVAQASRRFFSDDELDGLANARSGKMFREEQAARDAKRATRRKAP